MDTPKEIAEMTRHAEVDQMIAGMKTIMQASGAMFRQLKDECFSASQAFDMVKQWQHLIFTGSLGMNTRPEGKQS